MPSVALISHSDCLAHDPGAGHPEGAARLRTVLQALNASDFPALVRRLAPRATRGQLARAHAPGYVDAVLATRPRAGEIVRLDADTLMGPGSAEAALRAAGGAVAAVDLVMTGRVSSAFVAVRPPGHHADAARGKGYCIFNNVAVAARHARARWDVGRVAVADFDAHHGNGTESILGGETATLYASSHQYPGFPGTGSGRQPAGTSNVVNVPLLPNSTGEHFRKAWRETILPALDRFAPELLILSAGFDAHAADPSAYLQLRAEDFAWVTSTLVGTAARHADGRIVSVLEGGYDHRALAASVAAHVCVLTAGDGDPT